MTCLEFLDFGTTLAEQAGYIMQEERAGPLHAVRKPNGTLVTRVERVIQDLAVEAILKTFPGHAVRAEEGKGSYGPRNAQHIWRIDPIDGSGEYVEGGDPDKVSYGFGLAKQFRDNVEAGVFFNPSRNELFTAARGLGAFLNGLPIHVNKQGFEPGMGYDYHYWEGAHVDARVFEDTLGPPLGYYSAIYQGCMVALGRSAFSVFPGSTLHDIAPAQIIVTEAEGEVTDAFGNPSTLRGKMCGAIFSNGLVGPSVQRTLHG